MNEPVEEAVEWAESAATPAEIGIMRHALGASSGPARVIAGGHRNYYCASVHDEQLNSMVHRGLMVARHTINEGRDRYFSVSPKWCAALGITVKE